MKAYEMMFILSGAMKEDAVEKAVEKIKGEIARYNGNVTKVDSLGLKQFARPINKKETGFYVRMDVDFDPASVAAFNARLRLNEDIVRMQVTIAPDPRKLAVIAPVVEPALSM